MVFVDTNYSQCEELGFFTKKANIVLHKSTRCEAEHTRPSLCGLILANSDWSFPKEDVCSCKQDSSEKGKQSLASKGASIEWERQTVFLKS